MKPLLKDGLLTEKQMKCIEYLMVGMPYGEIAEKLDVSRQTISNWRRNEAFNNEYKAVMRSELADLAGEAKMILADLMRNSSSDSVRLNACKDILSRAGYDAVAKQEITTPDNIIITIGGDDEEKDY